MVTLSLVWVQLACAFRYGRDDLDVIGLSFRKDIWVQQVQLYPAAHKPTLTPMHETLLKKAGDQGHAFSFNVRHTQAHAFVSTHTLGLLYGTMHWVLMCCCCVLQIPTNLPCSVTLQPNQEDKGKVRTLTLVQIIYPKVTGGDMRLTF